MLESLPPAARTDLQVGMLTGTKVCDAGDHLVVRTPANPGYHWGNFLQVTTGDPDDADHWLDVFEAVFPEARHRAIGLPREPDLTAWEARGLSSDTAEALTRTEAPAAAPLATGYAVRPLTSDDDWELRVAADLAENEASGEYPPAEYEAFVRALADERQRLTTSGRSRWVGAFAADGALAASLGIVVLPDGTARYQSVLTGAGHRRRGLAGHLLAVAAQWAVGRGSRELVIVADADSDAGRLYRAAGFAPGPLSYGMYQRGREPLPAPVVEVAVTVTRRR